MHQYLVPGVTSATWQSGLHFPPLYINTSIQQQFMDKLPLWEMRNYILGECKTRLREAGKDIQDTLSSETLPLARAQIKPGREQTPLFAVGLPLTFQMTDSFTRSDISFPRSPPVKSLALRHVYYVSVPWPLAVESCLPTRWWVNQPQILFHHIFSQTTPCINDVSLGPLSSRHQNEIGVHSHSGILLSNKLKIF